jgi:hypothetical protein
MSRYLIMPSPAQLGTQIVTSDLVLNLDAANSASYSGTGNTWTDLSNNSNTGTLINTPTYETNNSGVFYFDGTNERIDVADANTLDFSDNFTIEMWFNATTIPSSAQNPGGLIVKRVSDQAGTGTWGIHVQNSAVSFWKLQATVTSASIGTITTNTWYHIVVTRSGSTIKGYLNTVEGFSITDSTNYTNAFPLVIGVWGTTLPNWAGSPFGPFNGRIAAVRVYKNKAFSAAEVTQNYNAIRGRFGL